ncbi:aromatic ring-hydroxylating oxygenase subunit alpha [Nocardioides marmotae]|uniref:aromatic ring-hydroxylating oxygenase subunit alpha n=1 Tax=Nocardioides marmotae TaxID=2663857 RepID=UPI0012B5BCD7|nr:Rieske 2Fe-2S domain-containing protein [Nocardioides marmotae]MBC9734454.1 Rieske 2Fe-2S domain-containing protein [Nocardioides marmotae]MTB85554.1 Rieske 2Fe-2S domain-containing protein [Nocardioides marmotae]
MVAQAPEPVVAPGVPYVSAVDPGIYVDPAVFAEEKKNIFSRTWIFLGHTSEVPRKGSFVTRRLLDDNIIIVRGKDLQVRAFYNVCRHRGMQVCRADDGETKRFTCPYHGWLYDIDGKLTSLPLEKPYFGEEGLDRPNLGLKPLERFAEYKGLLFGSISAEGESLEEFLGDFAWYLDIYLDRYPGGMEVIGEPQRWRVPCNWKIPSENLMGDTYHVQYTHRSVAEIGLHPNKPQDFGAGGKRNGVHIDAGHGTTGLTRQTPQGRGYPDEMVEVFKQHMPEGPRDLIFGEGNDYWPSRAHLWPNFSMLGAGAQVAEDDLVPYLFIRTWVPIDHETTEIWSWVLVEKEAPAEFKEKSMRAYTLTFGPAGTEEVDDAENFASMMRVMKGAGGRRINQILEMGTPEQMDDYVIRDWPGPGTAISTSYSDAGNRRFHHLWNTAMGREEAK